jgi:hypothetical protein
MKKTHTLGDQKDKNKSSEPKNGIWASKSVWSCFKFIDFLTQIPFLGSDCLFSPF